MLASDPGRPLFERVAERVEGLIRAGTLSAGDRLPSVRRAKAQFGVSAATIIEAYKRLEARGVIRARPQSGFYVRARSGGSVSNPPCTTRPAMRSVLVDAPGPTLVRFRTALPDASLLPTAQLARALSRVYRDRPETLAGYGPNQGCAELRHEIARRMLDAGCTVSPEQIVITGGATEAVMLSLQMFTGRGDTVAVESPTYHGLLDALRARGLKALPLGSCSEGGLSVTAFEQAARTRKVAALVLVANFSNPLGGTMPDECKARLVQVAREHGVPVIEDDIYGELGFEDPRPRSLSSFDPGGEVVLHCSSFSKVLSPGLRLGWCVPGRHYDAFLHAKADLNICTPLGPQLAVAELLSGGGFDRHLRSLRRTYQTLIARFTDRILSTFPEGTRVSSPRGGHVLWVELPPAADAVALLERAMERGISFTPGPLFAPDESFRNCLRLNCAMPWTERVSDALGTIGQLAREQIAPSAPPADGRARKLVTAL